MSPPRLSPSSCLSVTVMAACLPSSFPFGSTPKEDIVREAAWNQFYKSLKSVPNPDKGKGVKSPKNLADIICTWPLFQFLLRKTNLGLPYDV